MNDFWIVFADANRAIIFGKDKDDRRTVLLHRLENPLGRYHTSELVSDGRSRVEKKSGTVQSALEPHTDPHEQQAIDFANELGELIRDAAGEQKFDRLVLVAPAHFLGLLKGRLGKAKKRLAMCAAKEFVHSTLEELELQIHKLLKPTVAV